jgi:hypothetical protein
MHAIGFRSSLSFGFSFSFAIPFRLSRHSLPISLTRF